MSSDLVRNYFDRAAAEYSARSSRGWWNHFREREWRAVVPLLKPRLGEKLLELGCGAGFYSERLKQRFAVEAFGVDASSEMVKQAVQRGVPAWCGPVEEIDHIPSRSFDIVLAAGLLEFVADPKPALRQAARVLRPGGRLVILVPRSGALGLAYDWIHRWQGCPAWTRTPVYYIQQLQNLNMTFLSERTPTPISIALSFRNDSHAGNSGALSARPLALHF